LSSAGATDAGSRNSSYSDWDTASSVSSPIRSDRASGPIGWAQPFIIPSSMSSLDAKPDSYIRIEDRR
jgi:hypothetical protein